MSSKKAKAETMTTSEFTEKFNSSILRQQLTELEETKLKLMLNIRELKDKLSLQKDDQADIYYYLNKKCDEAFEVIASLEEQILNEQSDREINEKLYENRIEELKTSCHNTEDRYQAKVSELEKKLEVLIMFNDQKEESERNMKLLMNQLEEERIQFKTNAEYMENKFLLEREKLKKAYEVKFEKLKKDMEDTMESKMSNKAKKTHLMNLAIRDELDSQSKNVEKLLEINQQIVQRDKSLKLERSLASSLNEDYITQLSAANRTIRELQEKVRGLEGVHASTKNTLEKQLYDKTELLIGLEADLSRLTKKEDTAAKRREDVMNFIASSYYLLQAKRQRKAKREANSQNNLTSSNSVSADDVKMDGSQSVASLHSTAGTTADEDDKSVMRMKMRIGHRTIGDAREHEQMLIKVVQDVTRKFPYLFQHSRHNTPVARRGRSPDSSSAASKQPPLVGLHHQMAAMSSSSSSSTATKGMGGGDDVDDDDDGSTFLRNEGGDDDDGDGVSRADHDQQAAAPAALAVFKQTGLVDEATIRPSAAPALIMLSNPYRVLHKSIAVQTDGYFPPYPHGSIWNESPGLRGMLFQQQQQQQQSQQQRGTKKYSSHSNNSSSSNNNYQTNNISSGWKKTSMGGKGSSSMSWSLSTDRDDDSTAALSMDESNVSSLGGYHSHMGIHDRLDSIASYSEEDNQTTKSAPFAAVASKPTMMMMMPHGRSRSRYNDDIIAKARKIDMRNNNNNNNNNYQDNSSNNRAPLQQQGINASTGGSTSSAAHRSQTRPIAGSSHPSYPYHPGGRSPLIITDDLSSIPTSPTSTDRQTTANSTAGGGGGGGGGGGFYPRTVLNPNNHPPSSVVSQLYSPNNNNNHSNHHHYSSSSSSSSTSKQQQQQHSNSSLGQDMAIAGQGFVSPLVLPKL